AAILREHQALGGSESFALASSLVGADAFDVPRLPELYAWQRLPEATAAGAPVAPRELRPSPIDVREAGESVHLRFIVGSMLARHDVDLLARNEVGSWGLPLSKALSEELALAGATV